MRCIHIYRGAPQLGGIKLHKHFSWFHTAKWGVHRIAPRTVLHVIRIVLTMELQPLRLGVSPDSLVRNGSTSPIHTDYKRTHTHTHTHTRMLHACVCSFSQEKGYFTNPGSATDPPLFVLKCSSLLKRELIAQPLGLITACKSCKSLKSIIDLNLILWCCA